MSEHGKADPIMQRALARAPEEAQKLMALKLPTMAPNKPTGCRRQRTRSI
jgi:hypothetical protein